MLKVLRDSHNCSNRVHLAVDNPCLLYPNFYSLSLVSFETLQYVVWSGDSWLLENILAKRNLFDQWDNRSRIGFGKSVPNATKNSISYRFEKE